MKEIKGRWKRREIKTKNNIMKNRERERERERELKMVEKYLSSSRPILSVCNDHDECGQKAKIYSLTAWGFFYQQVRSMRKRK